MGQYGFYTKGAGIIWSNWQRWSKRTERGAEAGVCVEGYYLKFAIQRVNLLVKADNMKV